MVAGKVDLRLRLRPTRYRAGLRWWHCHPHRVDPVTLDIRYPEDAFNPESNVRFSARDAKPSRAMWYGAQSATAALWETLLRDVIGDDRGGVVLPRSTFAGLRLTAMRTRRELLLLELLPAPLRRLAESREAADNWLALTQTPSHIATHAATWNLLEQAARAGVALDGLLWNSRQAGTAQQRPVVGVLYEPPASARDLVIDPTITPVDLTDPDGEALIAAALAEAGLWRYQDDLDAIADEPDSPVEPKD